MSQEGNNANVGRITGGDVQFGDRIYQGTDAEAIKEALRSVQQEKKVDRPRNENVLLTAVRQEVNSRLKQSLHNAVLINLKKEQQPDRVKRPWSAEIKTGTKLPSPLSDETSILEVFDQTEIGGRLLILGALGAGKTTTMLDLAKALVDRAEQDTNAAIPVLVNLSSWKDDRQKIDEWLVAELKSKYGVSAKLGKTWIENRQLLPMLDGLDEVEPGRQEACVTAINRWLQSEQRPIDLTVCSRLEEYNNYTTKLNLNGAVCLQPLAIDQIQAYLTEVDRADLWQTLERDQALLELVKTPLLLSVSVLAYGEIAVDQWQQLHTTAARMEYLLDAYVRTMLHREILGEQYHKKQPPSPAQTRHWLIWLAQQLQEDSQNEFLIEQMQPSLLKTKRQKWAYRLVFGLISGLTYGLIAGLINKLRDGLITGLSSGVICVLLVELYKINPIEAFYFPNLRKILHITRSASSKGLIYGVIVSLLYGLVYGVVDGLVAGCFTGSIYGLLFLCTTLLLDLKASIQTINFPNQGILASTKNGVFSLAFSMAFAVGLKELLKHLSVFAASADAIDGYSKILIVFPVISLLLGGGAACLQHFSLRFVLHRNNDIPWNYARFLNYSTDRLLLQRVGGRYRFIHKLLQEHFAAMPLSNDQSR